jgi:hypothetical protein
MAVIADRLGVDWAAFKAWTARLDASRDFERTAAKQRQNYAQAFR